MKKVSKRIQIIANILETEDKNVWDLCCDHGQLGSYLLENKNVRKVFFVDRVPKIMDSLEKILNHSFSKERFECQTLDAHEIDPAPDDVITICGVGGQLAISLMNAFLKKLKESESTYLICAHYHMYDLRLFLKANHLKLISEKLIEDQGRMYELLYVSHKGTEEISLIGNKMWDLSNLHHLRYLDKTLSHYQKKGHQESAPYLLYKNLKDTLKD